MQTDENKDYKLQVNRNNRRGLSSLSEVTPQESFCSSCFTKCFGSTVAGLLWTLSFIVSLCPITWIFCFKTLNDYERAVLFRLGKYSGEVGPGYVYFWPFIDNYMVVDKRLITMDIKKQEMLTKESVTVMVNAVVLYFVDKPYKNIMTIYNSHYSTQQLGATALRAVIGESELDEVLCKRDMMNARLRSYLDKETDHWGLKITHVEIKDVQLPKSMQRAMGTQAESERERRAKVIGAEGEVQAAPLLLKAAETLSKNPASIQLRFLDTLREVSSEKNSTIVFPLPLEFIKSFSKKRHDEKKKDM